MRETQREIGTRLMRLRAYRQLRREEVAAAVGVSVSALCAYELGNRNPGDDVKKSIAAFYGVTVGELFFGEKGLPPG